MFICELLDKPVYSDSAPNARVKKIRLSRSCGSLGRILLDILWCYNKTKHSKNLSPVERIMIESKWTESMLKLLSLGNSTVMLSIRYRLREQTSEEDDEEEG